MYFYRARYYDPKAGRFITKDPIGYAGGINQFVYVASNPMNWIDPWGLIWVTIKYSYHTWSNLLTKGILNRIVQNIGRGFDPTMPGSDPAEYLGMK